MSIIADALRKAERERKQKSLEQARRETVENRTPPEFFSERAPIHQLSAGSVVSDVSESGTVGFRTTPFSWVLGEWSLTGIFFALVAAVLLLLPRWPVIEGTSGINWKFSFPQPHLFSDWASEKVGEWFQPKTSVLPQPESVPVPSQPAPVSFVLSGISTSIDGRYAVVNEVIVQEKDVVQGALVKEISDRQVKLQTEEGEIILALQR